MQDTQTIQTQASQVPDVAVTANAASLIRAFMNGALFACTDDTLPAICCLHLIAADGTLTVEATDRYVAAQETVPATGALDVLINAKELLAAVKPLATACKARILACLAEQPVITLAVDGAWLRLTLTGHLAPDQQVTVAITAGEFPRMARLWPSEQDQDAHSEACAGHAAFTADRLARLAKVDDGEKPVNRAVRFAFSTPAKPAVARVGENFRALIMPIRPAGS